MSAPFEVSVFEPPPGAERCRFRTEPALFPGLTAGFSSPAEAASMPPFERLFAVEGVSSLAVEHDCVYVFKARDASWPPIMEAVRWILREHHARGSSSAADTAAAPATDAAAAEALLRSKALRVLADEVNPGIAAHGGEIVLLDVKGTTLYVEMRGGCQGCGMSSVTLKRGVLTAMRRVAPEVEEVLDTTDHAAGRNPYYTAATT